MPLIRKYENRRLYDTGASRYVNLADVAAMVREGEDVRVVDAKTERDLTRDVLLQVILDAPGGADLLPVGMLRRIIRATGDDPVQKLVRQQLSLGLELLHGQLDQAESRLAKIVPPAKKAAAAPKEEPPPPPKEERDEEMDALRQRLAELEKRLRR
ncbi:MAG: polyhydroxyalkanoate synthesis regulator DNA-binding domain-containing protein [Myxococcota bacterium]